MTNILTLRYDPIQKPILPKLKADDFQKKNTYFSIEQLEKFYEIYKNTFSNLCSFKLSLIISNYKVITYVGQLIYTTRKDKL